MHQDFECKTYTLALFTAWGDGARGFEFQRSLCGAQEQHAPRPPLDSYCVVDEEHKTSFGGVRSVRLQADHLMISFSEQAQGELGLSAPDVSLLLGLSPREVEEVEAGLAHVFSYGPARVLPQWKHDDEVDSAFLLDSDASTRNVAHSHGSAETI